MTNRDASCRWTFDTYFPPALMMYLEVPNIMEAALEQTDNRCKGERTRDPSFPLALTMTSCVISCGMLSRSISLNLETPANDKARLIIPRNCDSVNGAVLNFSLNATIRQMQYAYIMVGPKSMPQERTTITFHINGKKSWLRMWQHTVMNCARLPRMIHNHVKMRWMASRSYFLMMSYENKYASWSVKLASTIRKKNQIKSI